LNPQSEGNAIRINVPAPSRERRLQLVAQVKKLAEDAKVAIRNERRDGIKHIDMLVKDKSAGLSEDDAKRRKDEIEAATKKHIEGIDQMCTKKSAEIQEV
jgi:ribosome recycling factor